MRRRLQRFLPIVLIALAVQILAPIAMAWAAVAAAADPLQTAEICHANLDSGGPADQGGGHVSDDGSCTICCVLHASGSVDTPQAVAFPTLYRDSERLIWGHQAPRLSSAPTRSNSRARAPPQAI